MPTARINGVELYFEEHGTGFPLLLLMGFGDDCSAWSLQVPAFSARYRTIVFDHRGVGRSEKPEDGYSIPHFSDDAIGLLDHLGASQAHLVGYSMGGRVAQDIAARRSRFGHFHGSGRHFRPLPPASARRAHVGAGETARILCSVASACLDVVPKSFARGLYAIARKGEFCKAAKKNVSTSPRCVVK